MQLLIQTTAPDYAAWKAAFDAEAENIAAASLNTLQIWKGDANAILVLFEVQNRKNAQAWLDKQQALGHGYTAQFLQTA